MDGKMEQNALYKLTTKQITKSEYWERMNRIISNTQKKLYKYEINNAIIREMKKRVGGIK